MTNRKTTRIYRVGPDRVVRIEKEYSLKWRTYVYRVTNYEDEARTLMILPTFAEARQFVRDLANEIATGTN